MKRQVQIFLVLPAVIAACNTGGQLDDQSVVDPMVHLSPDLLEAIDQHKRATERTNWLNCDGYLTNIEAMNYCSSELPGDWTSLHYQGEAYFYSPLASHSLGVARLRQ